MAVKDELEPSDLAPTGRFEETAAPILDGKSSTAPIAMHKWIAAALVVTISGGCGIGPEYTTSPYCVPPPVLPVQPVATVYANPIFIPVTDHQCAWEKIVDVVDDYFRIEHEESVRIMGDTATDGTITTVAEVSPTLFEPWRRDTGGPPQRLENTLQTMRRRAVVRVIPVQNGYSVDVQVFKELEDNRRPDYSTAGAATLRYDDTFKRIVDPIGGQPITLGWISQGRDASLEQSIIGDLLNRSGQASGPVVMRGQNPGPAK